MIKEPWPQSDLVERTELGKVNSTRLDEEFRSLVSLLLIFTYSATVWQLTRNNYKNNHFEDQQVQQ